MDTNNTPQEFDAAAVLSQLDPKTAKILEAILMSAVAGDAETFSLTVAGLDAEQQDSFFPIVRNVRKVLTDAQTLAVIPD